MTKREHKKMIEIKTGFAGYKRAYYNNIYCGEYSKSYTTTEIKEDVYNELKARKMLLGQ